MQNLKRVVGSFGLSIFLVIGGFFGGVALDRGFFTQVAPPANIPASAKQDFELIAQAWNVIQQNYVDRTAVVTSTLTYGAIGGMVDALGDTGHSRFLTPQMVQEEQNQTQGQLNGVGIEIQVKNGQIVVVSTIDNSPAQHAGLRSGDIIEGIDGKSTIGMSLSQVVSLVTGQPGTTVTLTIGNPQSGTHVDYKLTRAHITLINVAWQQLPGTTVADIRVSAFSQGVSQDLQRVLSEVEQQHITGIVLDLRNNPGGLLSEAVGVTSQFVITGNVLLEKDAHDKVTPVSVQPASHVTKLPMVILIDQGTASAAEITAGALQDAQRAQLIGDTTFGTGTVLNEFSLTDGSAILMAVEEWLTPSGRVIWHKGIAPNVSIVLPLDTAPLTPEMEKGMTADKVRASGDAQLLKAIELLTGKKY
jgi:carboxyl-terminal processing protease